MAVIILTNLGIKGGIFVSLGSSASETLISESAVPQWRSKTRLGYDLTVGHCSSERSTVRLKMCVRVCVCVRACVRACVRVCVCVRLVCASVIARA